MFLVNFHLCSVQSSKNSTEEELCICKDVVRTSANKTIYYKGRKSGILLFVYLYKNVLLSVLLPLHGDNGYVLLLYIIECSLGKFYFGKKIHLLYTSNTKYLLFTLVGKLYDELSTFNYVFALCVCLLHIFDRLF